MAYAEISPGVYHIGGGGYSKSEDCCVYLLDAGTSYILIDCGVNGEKVFHNLMEVVPNPHLVSHLVLTHGHIDHIGGLPYLKENLPQSEVVAHRLELPAVEKGEVRLTAADWYGMHYEGVPVDRVLDGSEDTLEIGTMRLHCLHTPGHTQGGISPYVDCQGHRVLFGQDIHGPFQKQWGSDMKAWNESMRRLLDLQADILCEGHYGVIRPKESVASFIEGFLHQHGNHTL